MSQYLMLCTISLKIRLHLCQFQNHSHQAAEHDTAPSCSTFAASVLEPMSPGPLDAANSFCRYPGTKQNIEFFIPKIHIYIA